MDPRQSVEKTGETVQAAVDAGLKELGVQPTEVLMEVIDEGSKGVFGIGAKPAKVRLTLLSIPVPKQIPQQDNGEEDSSPSYDDDTSVQSDETDDTDGEVGKEVLAELLKNMGISADIAVHRQEARSNNDGVSWMLDINGRDLRLLIGRRGETLNSLQYITRLITSRKLQRRANIVVDAGEYKLKRSYRLRQLAKRMAEQSVKQDKTMTLEPMPPNERRLIHMELRNHDKVFTKSVGDGKSRKVTIIPK